MLLITVIIGGDLLKLELYVLEYFMLMLIDWRQLELHLIRNLMVFVGKVVTLVILHNGVSSRWLFLTITFVFLLYNV